jgi:protein-disulfide isomerase
VSGAFLVEPVNSEDHSRGNESAAITLVEYGDYECPYCAMADPVVKQLLQEFGEDLRLIFRNLPLADVHPHAEEAAEFAEAVGLQGKFWEMHDALFENRKDLTEPALRKYATGVGAELEKLDEDLKSGAPRRRVDSDLESAIRSGANGTPTFFINGERYDASWSYEPFAEYLHGVLGR